MILTATSNVWIGTFFRRNLSHSHVYRQLQQSKRSKKLTTGAEIEGFKINQITDVPDFNCKLIRLEHLDTGAQYAHIDRDDSNNVFGIAFRTTPFDSTGIPHILEHLTLMGSDKYPCRDPFFKMLNRSLATYLNASTFPDFTIYPLATQNKIDYYNLMSVYLDAVFRPKLDIDYFQMEGWRLEHEVVEDRNSPIAFKGVVFNEMKGTYSENQSIFMDQMSQSLLPSHTYGVCSGGNPLEIPKLTYENLVTFRNDHYHPSNSRIYSYGNLDLVETLHFVNEQYLKDYSRSEEFAKKTYVPLEPRWAKPRRKHIFGKDDPLAVDREKQSMLTVSYLLADIRNVHEIFELKILSHLLIEGPNTPFYKNLVESQIGSGYVPTAGFDTHTRDSTFNIGLQALNEKDFDRVENTVYKTFDECIKHGFKNEAIENVLHSIELGIKHQGSNLGINLMFNLSPLWNHDGDLNDALQVSNHMKQFQKDLQDKFYLQKMVDKYFKLNSHRLVFSISPNESYEDDMKKNENELLQKMLSECSKDDLKKIYETGLRLRKIQETKEDIDCLPTLKKSDISRNCKLPQLHFPNLGVPVQVCAHPTNNVTYFRAFIDASELPKEKVVFLPLFAEVLVQMGTSKYNYREFDVLVENKTGRLNASNLINGDISNAEKFEIALTLSSICLDRNCNDMFELWSHLLNEVKFDDIDRFSTLVKNIASDLTNGVADSGHMYAMLNAASRVNVSAHIEEQFAGLTYIRQMKEVAGSDLSIVLSKIRDIGQNLLNKSRMRLAVNLSPEQHSTFNNTISNFISEIPGFCKGDLLKRTLTLSNSNSNRVHYVLPFAVNYCAKAIQTVPFTNPDFSPLRVLSKLLSTKYLLPLVRERFGAYGAGVKLSLSGVLQFFSYRDPNTVGTMSIFDDSAQWLRKNDFTDQDVDEAILAVFREIDAPLAPSDHGMNLFVNGISDELFYNHRLSLLKINREDLLKVGENYLQLPDAKVLIGSDNEETKEWQRIHQ